jgi:hypothetical protein
MFGDMDPCRRRRRSSWRRGSRAQGRAGWHLVGISPEVISKIFNLRHQRGVDPYPHPHPHPQPHQGTRTTIPYIFFMRRESLTTYYLFLITYYLLNSVFCSCVSDTWYSSIHLFIYSSIHLFIYSSIHLFIYSSIHLFISSSFLRALSLTCLKHSTFMKKKKYHHHLLAPSHLLNFHL